MMMMMKALMASPCRSLAHSQRTKCALIGKRGPIMTLVNMKESWWGWLRGAFLIFGGLPPPSELNSHCFHGTICSAGRSTVIVLRVWWVVPVTLFGHPSPCLCFEVTGVLIRYVGNALRKKEHVSKMSQMNTEFFVQTCSLHTYVLIYVIYVVIRTTTTQTHIVIWFHFRHFLGVVIVFCPKTLCGILAENTYQCAGCKKYTSF